MRMSIAELRKLPNAEKLRIVEALWSDLVENPENFKSPSWHAEALRETERKYARGEIEAIDWEAAKKELRKRFE